MADFLFPPVRSILGRAFSGAMREDVERWWLERQLLELNGLGDRLRFLATEGGDDDEQAGVHRRLKAIVEAVRWNEDALRRVVEQFLEPPRHYIEDAFGPAVVLEAIDAADRLDGYLESLDPETTECLRRTRTCVWLGRGDAR